MKSEALILYNKLLFVFCALNIVYWSVVQPSNDYFSIEHIWKCVKLRNGSWCYFGAANDTEVERSRLQQLMNSMFNSKTISLLFENRTCASFSPLSLAFTGVDSYCIQLWLFDSSCSLFSRKTNSRSAAFSGMFYFFPSWRRLVSSLILSILKGFQGFQAW